MAGWSIIPQSAGDANWASASGPWAELYAAWNERRAVLGQSPVTPPAAGDVIADKDWIQDIQSWCESYCSRFVATIDSGGSSVSNYDGKQEIEMWDWDKIKSRVLGRDWYRKNETGTEEGQQAAGWWASYIQLMNDLKAVLNELVWTLSASSSTYVNGSSTNSSSYENAVRYFGSDQNPTWETAKTNAESDWNLISSSSHLSPYQFTQGYADTDDGEYSAKLDTVASYLEANAYSSADGMTREVDYYVHTEDSYDLASGGIIYKTYDDYGTGFLEDVWNLWESAASFNSTPMLSNTINPPNPSTKPSPWCDKPPDYDSNTLGWDSNSSAGIVRWNVSGGLVYY